MSIHALSISHKRDICNPQTGFNLRQSKAMKKMSLKQILAANITKLKSSHVTLNTFKKIEKASGIGGSTIERAEKAQSAATVDTVEGIAAAFDIHPLRLLAPDMHIGPDALPPEPGYIRIPLINAPHGMGAMPAPVEHLEIVKYVEVMESWAVRALRVNPRHIKAVPGIGDSMKPTIEAGSIIFVDTSVRAYLTEGLYAIYWDGHVQVKRLQKKHGEDKFLVISDNEKYKPQEADESLVISGKVLAAWNFQYL